MGAIRQTVSPRRDDAVPPSRAAACHGLAILTALLALSAAQLDAQQIRGQLLDGSTKQPIAGGTMTLLDTALIIVHRASTTDEGEFLLRAPRPGSYLVRAERLGYRTMTDGVLTLEKSADLEIGFYLWPEPVVLDSIAVEARRGEGIVPYLEWQGFYERKQQGFGHFITPEGIERRMAMDMPHLFQGIPAVALRRNPAGGWYFQVRACPVPNTVIVMDGVRVPELLVHVNDIEAVEIYMGPATVPLQYAGTGVCGAVLIWTKH